MTPSDKLAALEARGHFALEVLQREESIDLARAALLVAAEEDDGRCDVERSVAALDEWGVEARARIEDADDTAVKTFNRYFFAELGFTGNQSKYYDPRNSFLNRVIERRTGIPITLSIVYMEIGRRAGLEVEGVGMPGHFIVRARAGEGGAVLVDPFAGRVIDEDGCQERLDMLYGGQVPLTEDLLRPTGTRDILVRLLNNLKGIYVEAELHARALAVVERLLVLAPHAAAERRDRGLLLAKLQRLPEAIAELRRYLALDEDAPDAEEVREQLKKTNMRLAMLN